MKTLVIKQISNLWTVIDDNGNTYDCKCIGKLKYKNNTPLVGDYVEIDKDNKIIKSIYKRKNYLVRPPVCNIDIAVILTSCIEPLFSSNLLDKMINIIEYNNIKPVICFTKYDLLDNTKNIDSIIKYYENIGYDVIINKNKTKLMKLLNNKICVFTGQTGVGKSTLLNSLDKELNLKTGEISKALGRGRHTTRHTQLLKIDNALIADTPGFSSLDFIGMNKKDIKDNFIEFYKNEDKCKYKDCMHIKEDGCYIKKLVDEEKILKSRYENYVKFIESLEEKRG